jgi:hypothetical protein
MAEARAAARQAKEDEKTRRYLDREEKKMNREIARAALEYDRNKAREERGRRFARTRVPEVSIGRPGRSPSRSKIDPEDLAAAAEAALGKPKPKAKAAPKASVAEVTAMAEQRFGKGRAKAKAAVKKQLKDTIRRVPVTNAKPKGRPKGSRNKRMESAVAAVTAA